MILVDSRVDRDRVDRVAAAIALVDGEGVDVPRAPGLPPWPSAAPVVLPRQRGSGAASFLWRGLGVVAFATVGNWVLTACTLLDVVR